MLRAATTRATKSGRAITIDLAFVVERLERGVCEVTGLPLDFTSNSPFVPSLDRRDNAQGYTPENTQVVVLMYNSAKSAGTHDDVMKLCEALCTAAKR
jgi:hypothetical protein